MPKRYRFSLRIDEHFFGPRAPSALYAEALARNLRLLANHIDLAPNDIALRGHIEACEGNITLSEHAMEEVTDE